MLKKRIIAKLEIKGDNLVKGIKLEGLRVLGKPEFFSEEYYKFGVDELIYQDVVASLYGKNALYDTIKKTSKNIFIPLTVGGGIRSVEEIYKILKAGADKVSINSQAIKNPKIVEKAIKVFGKSTIVANLEILKINGEYFCFYNNGRTPAKLKAEYWIRKLQLLGVGEIIITFIDNDGTGKGFDLEFINKIEKFITVPLIISGGAGKIDQINSLFKKTKVSGVTLGSLLHYNLIKGKKYNKGDFIDEGNIDFVTNNISSSIKFDNLSVDKIFKKLDKLKWKMYQLLN